MHLIFHGKDKPSFKPEDGHFHVRFRRRWPGKALILILFTSQLFLGKNLLAQGKINLSYKSATLQEVLLDIKEQTGYSPMYERGLLLAAHPVDIQIENASLGKVLSQLFKDQPFSYVVISKTIVITARPPQRDTATRQTITGRVISEQGEPVAAATIACGGTNTFTDNAGGFRFFSLQKLPLLKISCIGYTPQQVVFKGAYLEVKLMKATSTLDQVQVIAYGTSSRRIATGAYERITASDIARQPISNPLAVLSAHIPGMFIESQGGAAGSNFNVLLRGVNSISAGNLPLYVIDGIPFPSNSLDLITGSSTTAVKGGLSPLSVINPADIASIDILKDADATAIYGSRGANGVVLITTKKGQAGKTTVSFNIYGGIQQVGKYVKMMGLPEYLQIRRNAFHHDGIEPTQTNAPDLLLWDTTRQVDWQKELIGHTGRLTDGQLSLSGGDAHTHFYLAGSYHRNTAVFSPNASQKKGAGYLNIDHNSTNGKLGAAASISYSVDDNQLSGDPTPFINLPPNYPILDSLGKLIWRPGVYTEAYSLLSTPFSTTTKGLLSSIDLHYQIIRGLQIKANLGYNRTDLSQYQLMPTAAQNPLYNPKGAAYFGDNHLATWIAEPQLSYKTKIDIGTAEFLLGATWQQTLTDGKLIYAYNFSSDLFLKNPAFAGGQFYLVNNSVDYKYNAFFGRINYNYNNRYIFNATFRRDGSSRFGPQKRFGNFGALGAAWIFSEATAIKKILPCLSFGKIRGSYGITGNDQIGDYGYLSSYGTTGYPYLQPGIISTRIANPDFSWEINKKAEAAIDLGFFKDRLLLSGAYFLNRSSNMLVSYPLPSQSGFSSYQGNLPAAVQNTGIEITASMSGSISSKVTFKSSLNLTIPRNKLLRFPGIEQTSYGVTQLVVGQPLGLLWGYKFAGVDPDNGKPLFRSKSQGGTTVDPTYPDDYYALGTYQPKYYGGWDNIFTFGGLQLEFLLQFAKKLGPTPYSGWSAIPGNISGLLAGDATKIWHTAGAGATLPAPTTDPYALNYLFSDAGALQDATYVKLKNIDLSYQFPSKVTERLHMSAFKAFIQIQNLFTITHFTGFDPEATSAVVLPNLRTIIAGLHIEF